VVQVLDEHERTMAFAEVVLGQIRSLRQTAIPRNYEIWYVYATGYNAPLNKIINETLARSGKLTEADLEQIYETYLSHIKTTDRIDKVGARVIGEIDDVMKLLDEALGMSAVYDASLSGATERLATAKSRDQVEAIVETLIRATREMRETNKALEDRLTLSKNEISNLQQSLEAIRAESLTDPLTGLGNRKYFDRMIGMALQEALATGEPLSLLLFDIDHFKSFNDSYGHLTGDQVLRLVGLSLKQTIKGQDITARYGGEEFAVVLPHTALRQALTVADHIRRAVMAKELKKKSTGEILGRVTISVGVSMLKPGDDTYSLIERADACLYAAKRNGRNRVICEADPEYVAETRKWLDLQHWSSFRGAPWARAMMRNCASGNPYSRRWLWIPGSRLRRAPE
jgi:diguanylate cyclase